MSKLKQILAWLLSVVARAIVWRFKPTIIGVTGSVGKTSTKRAIAAVLALDKRVRASADSHNNEFGFPLAIIGDWSDKDLRLVSKEAEAGGQKVAKAFFWTRVLIRGLWLIVLGSRIQYPEVLVLEYGIDRPGDMRKLLRIARPSIGVVTAIGDIPVHVEFFAGPEHVAREKAKLIDGLPSSGFAVLNYDDATVAKMKDRTRAQVVTFGFGEGAMIRVNGFENRSDKENPVGVGFKIEYAGSFVPVRLDRVFGKTQGYAASAAASVGLIFGMNLVRIADGLALYRPLGNRMTLREGIKGTWLIDDSYNAAPLSMSAALETLRELGAKRHVAVLGDMLEIGEFTIEAHEAMGRLAAKSAHVLFTVGSRAEFIAEGARKAGMKKGAIFSFASAEEARVPVQDVLKKGDVVLIKASRAMHLEEIVEEIALPEGIK